MNALTGHVTAVSAGARGGRAASDEGSDPPRHREAGMIRTPRPAQIDHPADHPADHRAGPHGHGGDGSGGTGVPGTPVSHPDGATAAGTARPVPVVIGDVVGWFHPAVGGAPRRAAVLCPAEGYEALCAHRPWRDLAERLAAAGVPVLRLDYPGTGGAGGGEEVAPDLAGWADAVVAAAAALRRLAGVEAVSLVGLRLGGTVAAMAAGRVGAASLALLFPVLSGRGHARELKVLAQRTAEGPEILGYPWSDAALAAVAGLDAAAMLRAGGRPALLLARPTGLAAAEGVAAALPGARALAAEGFEALFSEAHAVAAPEAAFAEIVGFLAGDGPGAAEPDRPVAPAGAPWGAGPILAPPVLVLPSGVTERVVRFGPDGGLVGAWTEPAGGARAGSPVLLIPNTGANHHAGNGRLGVLVARRAAAAGIPALRFDSRGIGESENPEGLAAVRLVYQPSVVTDSRAALDWLEGCGHPAVTVLGVCAGAWTSLQLAVADRRVVRAVPVNLQRFVWREGRILTVPARRQSVAAANGLQWAAMRDAWRNRAGPLDLLRALLPPPVKLAYKRNVVAAGAWVGRRLPAGLTRVGLARVGPARVVGWLRALSARGTGVIFVYSDEDVGIAELESHFGTAGRHLARVPGMRFASLPGADHTLSTRAMRAGLLGHIGGFVHGPGA